MPAPIEIVDFDPTWASTFERLRSRYASALVRTPFVAIEHVGSTAVEGLAAKPVVDIDIVVATDDVNRATEELRGLGFDPLGEQGVAGRWAFRQPDGLPRTHTYVVESASLALRNHLAVRDTLRSDPGLRTEYARLKRALSASSATAADYVEGKSAFLLGILERAGFSTEELRAVGRANRQD